MIKKKQYLLKKIMIMINKGAIFQALTIIFKEFEICLKFSQ